MNPAIKIRDTMFRSEPADPEACYLWSLLTMLPDEGETLENDVDTVLLRFAKSGVAALTLNKLSITLNDVKRMLA